VLLVAATNKNLSEEISRRNFREDLYHRLSELSVRVPSLNERREDIPDLATHFLGKLYRTYRSGDEPLEATPVLTEEAKQVLVGHNYQGNIRELRSILLRALFFRKGKIITDAEIRRGIRDGVHEPLAQASLLLNEQLAAEIIGGIESGKDFWESVYEPYSQNRIARDVVRLIIDKSRAVAGKGMPQVARHLHAVTGDIVNDEEERKRFFKFKNFLYKTVKI
jgi:DNA-binding NtrC family response regulator